MAWFNLLKRRTQVNFLPKMKLNKKDHVWAKVSRDKLKVHFPANLNNTIATSIDDSISTGINSSMMPSMRNRPK